MLRAMVGTVLVVQGAVCITNRQQTAVIILIGLVLLLTGASVLLGFLTPVLSVLAALELIGIAFSWLPVPVWGPLDSKLALLGLGVVSVTIFLLGPGAFSFDARLFGWREIVIPPTDPSGH